MSEKSLLEKVDTKFETRLLKIYWSRKLPFRYYSNFITLAFLLTIYFIAAYLLYLISKALPSALSTPSEALPILISTVATLIALASFATNLIDVIKPESEYEIWTTYNYEVLKKMCLPKIYLC